jgi:hypothetical protein
MKTLEICFCALFGAEKLSHVAENLACVIFLFSVHMLLSCDPFAHSALSSWAAWLMFQINFFIVL